MPRDERGVMLVELLAALLLLAVAGLAAIALLQAGLRAERDMAARERGWRDADRLLAAHTLLTRADLHRRLGERRAGGWLVRVDRPEPALFRIAIADTLAPTRELLVTVVHRPAAAP